MRVIEKYKEYAFYLEIWIPWTQAFVILKSL